MGEFSECMGNSLGMGKTEIAGFEISKELEGNSIWGQIFGRFWSWIWLCEL